MKTTFYQNAQNNNYHPNKSTDTFQNNNWKGSPMYKRNHYRPRYSKPKYVWQRKDSPDSNKTCFEQDKYSTESSRKSSKDFSTKTSDKMSGSFLSKKSSESPQKITYPYRKPNGHVSNPLSYDDTFRLKVNPQTILRRGVKNLHLKNIPKEFTLEDIELLLDEKKESLILINHPYSKSQHKFLTYCFVLLDDEREAASLCRKWDRKNLVDFCGNSKRMQVFQGVQLPKEFLLKILQSKGINHKVIFFLDI